MSKLVAASSTNYLLCMKFFSSSTYRQFQWMIPSSRPGTLGWLWTLSVSLPHKVIVRINGRGEISYIVLCSLEVGDIELNIIWVFPLSLQALQDDFKDKEEGKSRQTQVHSKTTQQWPTFFQRHKNSCSSAISCSVTSTLRADPDRTCGSTCKGTSNIALAWQQTALSENGVATGCQQNGDNLFIVLNIY